jgi:hypothetical protein
LQHPLTKRAKVRPFLEPDQLFGPAGHHEEVRVGKRKVLTHLEGPRPEPTIDPVELLGKIDPHELLELLGRLAVEYEAEALVQLCRDEIDQLENTVAPEVAQRREHLGPARPIAEKLQDHGILGEHFAALELERRNGALGIDIEIVAAVFQPLRLEVDPHGIMLEPDLVK